MVEGLDYPKISILFRGSQVASCVLGAKVGVQKLKCSTKEVVLRNVCELLAAIRST